MTNSTIATNQQPKQNLTINGNESGILTILTGRLTAPITVEQTTNGKKFANFSIAFNTVGKDSNGENQPVTCFYNLTAWEAVAEALGQTVGKGDFIKLRVRVTPHIYPSHKKQDMIPEMKMTANRFKLLKLARANQ